MSEFEKTFILHLTNSQGRLLGYLTSLLGDLHDARDVLQATNLVIWEKQSEFQAGAAFEPWARKCAYFQALAFIRDRKRDRHVFDEELLEKLSGEAAHPEDEDLRELALRDCLTRLPKHQRRLIECRYKEGASIYDLAKRFDKKESAAKVALMRIRQALMGCIENKLEEMPS